MVLLIPKDAGALAKQNRPNPATQHIYQLPRLLVGPFCCSPLAFPLGIDASGEGVFVAEGDLIDDIHPHSEEKPSWLAIQDGDAKETASRSVVHGRVGNVERETRDHAVHEDAEVVAQKCACDAQSPGGRYDENVPHGDQGICEVTGFRGFEERVGRLVAECMLVEAIADKAQGEDGCGKSVAGCLGVAPKELSKGLVVVFLPRYDVPEERVEGDGQGRDV